MQDTWSGRGSSQDVLCHPWPCVRPALHCDAMPAVLQAGHCLHVASHGPHPGCVAGELMTCLACRTYKPFEVHYPDPADPAKTAYIQQCALCAACHMLGMLGLTPGQR